MAQYIYVYMDGESKNFKNKGLYDIIVFIGEQKIKEQEDKTIKDAYKVGKKAINSRLHKWHSTAIERLVVADKIKYAFNYDKKTIKPIWKIHRNKAKRIFNTIHCILRKYNNPDISNLFDTICKNYGFSLYQEAVGSPYYSVISKETLLSAQEYDQTDIDDLTSCADEIKSFSSFQ